MQQQSGQTDSLFRRRRFLEQAAGGALTALGLGCTRPLPPGPAPPPDFTGAVVRVAGPDGPAAVVEHYGRAWAARTGARLEVVRQTAASPDGVSARLLAPAELAHWAAAGRLTPLPAELLQRAHRCDWDGLLLLYRKKLLLWGGEAFALPVLGDAQVCFYRADLFRAAARQAAFPKRYGRPLAAPAAWEDLVEIAEFFHEEKLTGPAGPVAALPPLPAQDAALDELFYTVAAPFARLARERAEDGAASEAEAFSFHFDLQTGRPRIDAPGFVAALKLLQRLQAFRPAGTTAAPAEAFRRGQAVLCLAAPQWAARCQEPGSPFKGELGVCPVPGSRRVFDYQTGKPRTPGSGGSINHVPYLGAGGWVGVVPRTSPHPEAAFDLLAELCSPAVSEQVVADPRWGGGVFRHRHFQREGWLSFRLSAAQTTELIGALERTLTGPQLNPVVRLRTPDQQDYQQALTTEVRAVLTEGRPAEPALTAVARRWAELAARQSPRDHLAAYSQSLGLTAAP